MIALASVLLGLLLDTACQAQALAADAFRDRVAAQRRLRARGPLALPAIAAATLSSEPERRRRAEKLLAPWLRRWEQDADAALLSWLAHDAGDDWPPPDWVVFLHGLGQDRFHRLVRLSRRRSLVSPGEEEHALGSSDNWSRCIWAHRVRWKTRLR